MPYHQNSAGHGGRRGETARKTEVKIHGHHQEGHQKECADGRQHSRPQELEIGSVQGDPLTWKSLQGEKVRSKSPIEDAEVDVWSDKKRQNQERTHPRNDESSTGVQKDNGEKTEMVWARHEDGRRSRSEESDDESDTGEKEERETKDKVEGCVQEGHADCRTERGR